MTAHSPVHVGIIGLGGIGHHHAERIEAPGELVGGVDINKDARTAFADAYDVPTYAESDALFADADAVLITTPNRFHEQYAVAALEAGCNVLLEKPLAHTLESAERIAAAAADADAFCMIGFNNRFAPTVEVIKAYQDAGRFGELTHIEANYIRRRGIPGRGSWFTSKEVAGGGSLIDIGVHALDLALYVLDFPAVTEVSGQTRSEFGGRDSYASVDAWSEDNGPNGFDVDDSATAFVRTENNQTIVLDVAWATNEPVDNGITIRGTEAGAQFDRKSHELTLYEASQAGGNHYCDTSVQTETTDTYRDEQAYFFEHVATETDPEMNTVEQGLAVQRVLDAIYRSSETGQAVSLDS